MREIDLWKGNEPGTRRKKIIVRLSPLILKASETALVKEIDMFSKTFLSGYNAVQSGRASEY